MSNAISIKRGLDIKLKGSAEKIISQAPRSSVYAVKPTDFIGMVPKLSESLPKRWEGSKLLFV